MSGVGRSLCGAMFLAVAATGSGTGLELGGSPDSAHPPAGPPSRQRPAGSESALGQGTFNGDSGWRERALDQVERTEYEVTPAGRGAQAPNRAQGFRTRFREESVEVVPRVGVPGWRFAWRTTSWGRESDPRAAVPVEPSFDGARVEYARDGLIEWYENRPDGVEQGFTVERRPPGRGELRVEGRIDPSLHAELDARENAVDFHATRGGARILRYEKLQVWDADGHDLPARLMLEDDQLAIVIDDASARYPITIDPILDTPGWSVVEDLGSQFGESVATAGDVNGDGFSDVIIGASLFDTGEGDEGRAFVYHGSASGLETTPAWTADGDTGGARFGCSVAAAGDVNGDGYADVIVGASSYDDIGQNDEGRAYVYHGSAKGLEAAPAWTIEGDQFGAFLGGSVATAGDVNGDGYWDVIVGAALYDSGQPNSEGLALVYHGSANGLAGTPDWSAEGNQNGARFGHCVATAGDVDGDGYDDVVVGAPFFSNDETDEGRVFVYHGSALGLSTTAAWTAESDDSDAQYGFSVATAGDVNGDGFSDVVVGAPIYGASWEGQVFAYLGSESGLADGADFSFGTGDPGSWMGYSVATAGDIDGDGRAEIIAGAPKFDSGGAGGAAYVLKWAAGSATQVWSETSVQSGDQFGRCVGTTGDVDGDGYSEIIVGAIGAARASVYEGFGSTLSPAVATLTEGGAGNEYGAASATAGDVNGDGYDDVIVGAHHQDGEYVNEGRAFLYNGSENGVSDTPSWSAAGDGNDGWWLGHAVASAGDVNGDGYADVIVGAPHYDDPTSGGAAFVYHGSVSGLPATPSWQAVGNEPYGSFGWSVATAGDVNGDGFSDVVIGATRYGNGEDLEGAAFVHYGSPTGLGPAVWAVESNLASTWYGGSVGSAGDVNGDGFSDVIVGASGYDDGGVMSVGKAFLYLGSAEGLDATHAWSAVGDVEWGQLGYAVGNAGDVNGDGFSDVIISAVHGSNGEFYEGMAFVYHGSSLGPGSSPDWAGDGDQIRAHYGYSAETAGDVNGDGYSDIIVGSVLYDNGQEDEGKAFLYLGSPDGLADGHDLASVMEGQAPDRQFGISAGTAGDVNGDGFSDVIVGAAHYATQGSARIYLGNGGDGATVLPIQAHTDDAAHISPLGLTNSLSSFLVKVHGQSPGGRDRVRLEVEVKPFGVPFTGTNLLAGPEVDTGVSGVELSRLVTGLFAETLYTWRARIVTDSPFFPRSRWFSISGNAATEADVRTQAIVAVDDPGPGISRRLSRPSPNPFRAATQVAFTLQRRGEVRLAVYDVTGREVALLADGRFGSGRHVASWNGRTFAGRRATSGIYFLRLDLDGASETRKIVLG